MDNDGLHNPFKTELVPIAERIPTKHFFRRQKKKTQQHLRNWVTQQAGQHSEVPDPSHPPYHLEICRSTKAGGEFFFTKNLCLGHLLFVFLCNFLPTKLNRSSLIFGVVFVGGNRNLTCHFGGFLESISKPRYCNFNR